MILAMAARWYVINIFSSKCQQLINTKIDFALKNQALGMIGAVQNNAHRE